ncbi:DNA polymerase Y family protein [Streptantibioticus silvisoli]|uniref:DNA polymerase Y family protein n=1 Tax=Streptantibioticus silvisoli TaxID=2705255 RepID=UPI003F6D8D87
MKLGEAGAEAAEAGPEPGERGAVGRQVLYVCTAAGGPAAFDVLLSVLRDITPVVEALPPDAALADVTGSTRYFGRDAAGLGALIRVRALARYDVDCTVGVAANPLLARMAAHDGPPGAVRAVGGGPGEAAAFLDGKPVGALHGVGPKTARTLCDYGLDTVDRLAAAPLPTVQRLLGARLGRLLRDRAHGADPTPVSPNAPARSVGADHRFDRPELDPGRRHRALLALAAELGLRLRADDQVARGLTLTVRYADRSATTRTRALPEPTAHTPALATAAYALHDALRLQRARVTAVALRAEDLTGAAGTGRQLTFDPRAENIRRAESVTDRIAARWPGLLVGPASLAGLPRRSA